MDEVVDIRVLDEDEELPPDAIIMPPLEEMEPEAAVKHLMEFWGLDEVDARFHLALARGETDGDTHAIDEHGKRVRKPRPKRRSA